PGAPSPAASPSTPLTSSVTAAISHSFTQPGSRHGRSPRLSDWSSRKTRLYQTRLQFANNCLHIAHRFMPAGADQSPWSSADLCPALATPAGVGSAATPCRLSNHGSLKPARARPRDAIAVDEAAPSREPAPDLVGDGVWVTRGWPSACWCWSACWM